MLSRVWAKGRTEDKKRLTGKPGQVLEWGRRFSSSRLLFQVFVGPWLHPTATEPQTAYLLARANVCPTLPVLAGKGTWASDPLASLVWQGGAYLWPLSTLFSSSVQLR